MLREAFDYGYAEIAQILCLTPVNARKVVSRARKHLAGDGCDSVDVQEHRRLLDTFVAAAQEGDVASLEALLTPDAVSLSDGNGLRGAARVPVVGRARVANLSTASSRFWPGSRSRPWRRTGVQASCCAGTEARRLHDDRGHAPGHPPGHVAVQPRKISAFLASRARSVPLSAHAGGVVAG